MKKGTSTREELENSFKQLYKLILMLVGLIVILLVGILVVWTDPSLSIFQTEPTLNSSELVGEHITSELIENGIHVETGFIDAPGMMVTIQNCTNCHSSKLVIQNRMNAERWVKTIRWMQETQNLWDLGENEQVIIDYLVTNYPPKKVGRRANLQVEEWYELK